MSGLTRNKILLRGSLALKGRFRSPPNHHKIVILSEGSRRRGFILDPAVQATKIAYRLRLKSLLAIEVSSKAVNCEAVQNYGEQTPL